MAKIINDLDHSDMHEIIKQLKLEPSLHNPKSVAYNNQKKKHEAYERIAMEVNSKSSTNYYSEDIKENIKNLKKEYRKCRNNNMKMFSKNKKLPEAPKWWRMLYSFIKDQNQLNNKVCHNAKDIPRTLHNRIKRYLKAEKAYKLDSLESSNDDDSDASDDDEEGSENNTDNEPAVDNDTRDNNTDKETAVDNDTHSNNTDDKSVGNSTEKSALDNSTDNKPAVDNSAENKSADNNSTVKSTAASADDGPDAKKRKISLHRSNIIESVHDFEADLIIRALQKEPCLCNPKHRHYKNKSVREAAYKRIADSVNEFDDSLNFTANDVKSNLQILRKQFLKCRQMRLRQFALHKRLNEPDDWWRYMYDILLDELNHGEDLCIHKPLTKSEVHKRFGKLIDSYHKYEGDCLIGKRCYHDDDDDYESDNEIMKKTSCTRNPRVSLFCMKLLPKWK